MGSQAEEQHWDHNSGDEKVRGEISPGSSSSGPVKAMQHLDLRCPENKKPSKRPFTDKDAFYYILLYSI